MRHQERSRERAWTRRCFTHVSNIYTSETEDVFEVGNIGHEAAWTAEPMYSVSVGDVVEDPQGVRHVVASVGFKQLA